MKTNVAVRQIPVYTHEGARASRIGPEQELRRTVAACLLWEDNFYEDGQSIAQRIKDLVPRCRPEFVAACAFEARTKQKLRHAPLLLVREMSRATPAHRLLVGKLLPDVIQRADELAEFLVIYWKDGNQQPVSKQVKKGLAAAFLKFDEYQLAKYNRDGAVKLRDALFQCHAKPQTKDQEALFKKLVDNKLETPDTWEVELSAGNKDKRASWTRLLLERKLGALAFLRNLRNMTEAGIEKSDLQLYADQLNLDRVLPFRFIAAARVMPQLEDLLEPLMLRACADRPKLSGKTTVLLDVSSSMNSNVSTKSDITRLDAACGVAILLRELCEEVEVLTFSDRVVRCAPRRGFALRDAIVRSQPHSGTYLGEAVKSVHAERKYDRLVVLTDEQSADAVPDPIGKGYVINVASHKNGVGYGKWNHIDGWSEAVIDYLQELEALEAS